MADRACDGVIICDENRCRSSSLNASRVAEHSLM